VRCLRRSLLRKFPGRKGRKSHPLLHRQKSDSKIGRHT
jgi:hypothetical protein